MSSTLTQPASTATTVAEPIPARAPASTPAVEDVVAIKPDHAGAQDEREFRGFVKAILIGCGLGTLALFLLIVGMLQVVLPEFSLLDDAGIGLWVSLWCGLFLGGTVTVGLWARKNH